MLGVVPMLVVAATTFSSSVADSPTALDLSLDPTVGTSSTSSVARLTGSASIAAARTSSTTDSNKDEVDPLEHGLWFSLFDGVWGIALTVAWGLNAQSLEEPQPDSIAALFAVRFTYGFNWSLLLAGEVALASWIAGPKWPGLSHASYRVDWLVGFDVPGDCIGDPICGFGLGGWSEVRVRFFDGPWFDLHYALNSGWIHGRLDDNASRNLTESTLVTGVANVRAELPLSLGPVSLSLTLGPGVFYGMHNAHVKPKPGSGIDVPWFQLVPLEWGAGVGGYGSVDLGFFDTVYFSVKGELVPFPIAGVKEDFEPYLAPLQRPDPGALLLWRRFAIGATFDFAFLDPVDISLRYFLAELSTRPFEQMGHRAAMLQFTVPINLYDD